MQDIQHTQAALLKVGDYILGGCSGERAIKRGWQSHSNLPTLGILRVAKINPKSVVVTERNTGDAYRLDLQAWNSHSPLIVRRIVGETLSKLGALND